MKKYKIILLVIGLIFVVSISLGLTLYFTLGEAVNNPSDKIDLNQENLQYLAKTENMNNITETEANTIKTEIKININNKMNNLNLQENIDYQISNNLDMIKSGDHLNDYIHHIIISSINTSEKATGNFTIIINVEENINNRTIEPIIIDINEREGLSEDVANSIKNNILIKVQTILSQGQINQINVDYQIINFDLIKPGAKFEEYNNQIIIKGISNRLTGQFLINFIIG